MKKYVGTYSENYTISGDMLLDRHKVGAKEWLDRWFEDDLILRVQTRSDVEVAMKHMGVSYK